MSFISGFYDRTIARQFFKENNIDALIELYYASIVGDFLIIATGILVFVVVRRITKIRKPSGGRLRKQRKITCLLYLPNVSMPIQTRACKCLTRDVVDEGEC